MNKKIFSFRIINPLAITLLFCFSHLSFWAQNYCDTVVLESNLPDSVLMCGSDSVSLSAATGFASYQWSRGDTLSAIDVVFSGNYFLTITDDSSCVSVDTVTVSVINAGFDHSDTLVCVGDSISYSTWQSLNNMHSIGFNGSNASVSFPDSVLPIANEQRSFEAWVYNAGQSSKACVFSYGDPVSNKVFEVYIDQYDSLILKINQSEFYSTETLPLNAWSHIMVGTDVSNKYIFRINGGFAGSDFITGVYDTDLEGIAFLGRSAQPTSPAWFNGKLDEVRIWNGVLPGAVVTNNMYFHTNNLFSPNLLLSFDCNYFVSGNTYDMNGVGAALNNAISSTTLPFSQYSYHYTWSNGELDTSTEMLCMVSDTLGLSISDGVSDCSYAVHISVPQLPNLQDSVIICNQPSYDLQSTNSYSSYQWNTGNQTAIQSVTISGNYVLTVSEGGCTYSDSTFVSIIDVEVLTPDTAICPGTSITLEALSNTADYSWSIDAQTAQVVVTPQNSMSYTVFSTDGINVCSDVVLVTVYPDVQIGLADSMASCNTGMVLINAANSMIDNYMWSNGETTQFIITGVSGLYQLTATDINGCQAEDEVQVAVQVVDIVETDTLVCGASSFTLNGQTNTGTYNWSNGATTSSIIITASGTYSLLLDENGFQCADQVVVELAPPIELLLPDTLESCSSITFMLNAGPSTYDYEWNTGAIGNQLVAFSSGEYISVATDSFGCQASDTAIVSIIDAFITISDTLVCENEQVIVSTNSTQYEYLWSNGATDALIFDYPGHNTNYFVYVSDDYKTCTYMTSVDVMEVETGPIMGSDSVLVDSLTTYYVASTLGSTYEWFVSGGVIVGDTTNSIDVHWGPGGLGYVSVVETTINGCIGEDSELDVAIHYPFNITENQLVDDVLIAPNPMHDFAKIIVPAGLVGGTMQLFDISGKLLIDGRIDECNLLVNRNQLASGMYWLKFSKDSSTTKKLIIQ